MGATDELSRGQSTFMVEMTETANILHNATPHSLVILDEIGRGTSTFDGISLAWAITEHLHDAIGCRTLFATHYHELVELEKTKPRLRNANVAVRESQGEIVFLHRIVPGGADQSYGIHVARLAGVPAPVLDRAREILAFLEKQHGPDPGLPEGPIRRKVKTGRALAGSLFAALPDPLLEELRHVDLSSLSPEQALALVKRLRELAGVTGPIRRIKSPSQGCGNDQPGQLALIFAPAVAFWTQVTCRQGVKPSEVLMISGNCRGTFRTPCPTR